MTNDGPSDEWTPPLSVVIPFYKDDAYIEEAIQSTIGQDISGLEIIVVNDNPGPDSKALLEGLARLYPIRIVAHDVNRGLAAARNTGVKAATAPLVTFIDADDIFVAKGLARNLAFALESGADIVHAPTLLLPVLNLRANPLARDTKLFGKGIVRTTFAEAPEAQYIVSSWASIYRRAFLLEKNVWFDEEQRRYEDRLFVLRSVFASESIGFSNIPARLWRRRLGSITTGPKEFEDISMQMDLVSKCVAEAKAYAGAEGDRSMALQRELHHAISRVIWDVRILEFEPAETPELDAARARLTASLAGLKLRRTVFSDLPTLKISNLYSALDGHGAVTRAMLLDAYAMVAEGRWSDLVAWRRAQRLPQARGRASRTSDKELILHIGLHKTGTTFLQRLLERDRERLAEAGLLFPQTGFVASVDNNLRAAATPGHVGYAAALRRDAGEMFEKLFDECAASPCERVLISAENLSFPFESAAERAELLKRAADLFGGFARRRVLAVFRRPDDYVDRYWREHVFLSTGWARRSTEQFAAELGPNLTDLRHLVGDWGEFADGEVTLLGYDAAGRNLAGEFYSALGLPAPNVGLANGVVYPSPTAEQAFAARLITLSRMDRDQKTEALGAFLKATEHLPRVSGASVLRKATRLRLIDRFVETSLPYLRANGADAPTEAWRSEVEAMEDAPLGVPPEYFDAAVGAMSTAGAKSFQPAPNPYYLRLYRLGRRIAGRVW